MGDGSKIEWTDATWNPLVGCSKASAGCDNCYAIRVAHRGMSPQHRGLTVVPEGQTGPEWNGLVNLVPGLLDQPLRWQRPRRIFVNSLSDLFHPEVPTAYIEQVFAIMALAPRHVFQVLTKRPKRMRRMLNDPMFAGRVAEAGLQLSLESKAVAKAALRAQTGEQVNPALTERGLLVLPNVWLGVSVEDNAVAWRARELRDTPAAVRWISAEPMIGPLDAVDLSGMDWIVAGGESGPGARPLHPDWLRNLRDRCEIINDVAALPGGPEGRTGTAFHFKQWGDWSPGEADASGSSLTGDRRQLQRGILLDREGAERDTNELSSFRLPDGWVRMAKVGKGKAGRELDGRTWDDWPPGHEALGEWSPEAGTRNTDATPVTIGS